MSGPATLCVGRRRTCVSARCSRALCVGTRCFLCPGPRPAQRSLCRAPTCTLRVGVRRILGRASALSASGVGALRSLSRAPALCVSGPGALCVPRAPAFLRGGRALSVLGPGALCVGPTLSCTGALCVGHRRSLRRALALHHA